MFRIFFFYTHQRLFNILMLYLNYKRALPNSPGFWKNYFSKKLFL